MSCDVCEYAATHDVWPPELVAAGETHCDGCHRTWASIVEAHCVGCHLHFTSEASAALHDPYCHPDTETTRKRLLSARRSSGRPILVLRHRKHGSVFATPSSKTPEHQLAGVS